MKRLLPLLLLAGAVLAQTSGTEMVFDTAWARIWRDSTTNTARREGLTWSYVPYWAVKAMMDSASGAVIVPTEQLVLEARCVEPGGIEKGRAVTVTGATGFRADVQYADIYDTLLNDFVGVANESKLFGQQIQILIRGRCSDIKTDYDGWQEGDQLYLCDTGCLTNVRPDSGTIVHVGYVLRTHSNHGEIEVAPFNERNLAVGRGRGLFVRLGDSTGATAWEVRDWQNNTVAWIGSDGRAAIGTGEKPDYDSLVGLRVIGNPCLGDVSNRATGIHSMVSGGERVTVSGNASGGFGYGNIISGTCSGGFGFGNTFSGLASGGFGYNNVISGGAAGGFGEGMTISGSVSGGFGFRNTISGYASGVLGGQHRVLMGNHSMTGGLGRIDTLVIGDDTTFTAADTVWADNHFCWPGTASFGDTSGPRPGAVLTVKGMANCDSFTGDGSLLTGVVAELPDSITGTVVQADRFRGALIGNVTGNVTGTADSAKGAGRLQGKDTTALKAIFGTKAADDLATAKADSALGGFDRFRATNNAIESIPTGSATLIYFETEQFDALNSHSITTGFFKPKVSGYYYITAGVVWTSTNDQGRYSLVIRNGTATNVAESRHRGSGTGTLGNTVTTLEYVSTAESIAVYGYQDSGAKRAVSGTAGENWFAAHFLSR